MENNLPTNFWDFACYLCSSWFGILCLVLIVIIIIVEICNFVKKSKLKLNTKVLELNLEQNTRSNIREELDYIGDRTKASLPKLRVGKGEEFKAKYSLKVVEDKLEKMCIFNNIDTSKDYVSQKQDEMYNIVMGLVFGCEYQDYYLSKEFKEDLYNWVEDVIRHLYSMKERFRKQKDK